MRAIKVVLLALVLIPASAFASDDAECLNHLGGAMADIDCYHTIALTLKKANKENFSSLLKTMPKGNKNIMLLQSFMQHVTKGEKFCELSRQAPNKWVVFDGNNGLSEHSYYDGIYYRCIYDQVKSQNTYLNMLLNLEKTGSE